MIKLLHAADFHLDSPFSGLSPDQAALRRREQRQLLGALVELCNANSCDLMLLAGDLFDSDNAYPDTIEAMQRAFSACTAQIVIAPGNHDYAAAGSAYRTQRWPENVHIFTESSISYFDFPQLGCRVYGAAFTAPQAGSLLEGFRTDAGGLLPLMALHGDALNAQSPYNAISRAQIGASGLRYLALGHIHAGSGLLREGETYYAWPGCLMGRGFDETGEKGALLTEVDERSCTARFLPLGGRRYEILSVPAGDDPLSAILSALPEDTKNDSYRIRLTGEAERIDCAALYRTLAGRFFSLSLRDETTPKADLWAAADEDTLRGGFLRALRARYDAADDEQTRRRIADAARLGIAAMDGREEPAL